MLAPIPAALLGDMMTLKVCTGMDAWQNPTWQEYTVKRVHLQNTNEVRKSKENTEVLLRAVLFVDARHSLPRLDYTALAAQSEQAGAPMRCTVYGPDGADLGDYQVLTVDLGPNFPDRAMPHHAELGLV